MASKLAFKSLYISLFKPNTVIMRQISTLKKDCEDKIVMTDNGSVFVCWHPEKPFPYEYSKPYPEIAITSNTVFKIENKAEILGVFKKKTPEATNEELQRLTFTTKHRWYPRARDKRAKKTERDRPYL